jgi:hypothetical protein
MIYILMDICLGRCCRTMAGRETQPRDSEGLPVKEGKKLTSLGTIILYQVGTIKEWLYSLFQQWQIYSKKEHKKKNKVPIKPSPLKVLKSVA